MKRMRPPSRDSYDRLSSLPDKHVVATIFSWLTWIDSVALRSCNRVCRKVSYYKQATSRKIVMDLTNVETCVPLLSSRTDIRPLQMTLYYPEEEQGRERREWTNDWVREFTQLQQLEIKGGSGWCQLYHSPLDRLVQLHTLWFHDCLFGDETNRAALWQKLATLSNLTTLCLTSSSWDRVTSNRMSFPLPSPSSPIPSLSNLQRLRVDHFRCNTPLEETFPALRSLVATYSIRDTTIDQTDGGSGWYRHSHKLEMFLLGDYSSSSSSSSSSLDVIQNGATLTDLAVPYSDITNKEVEHLSTHLKFLRLFLATKPAPRQSSIPIDLRHLDKLHALTCLEFSPDICKLDISLPPLPSVRILECSRALFRRLLLFKEDGRKEEGKGTLVFPNLETLRISSRVIPNSVNYVHIREIPAHPKLVEIDVGSGNLKTGEWVKFVLTRARDTTGQYFPMLKRLVCTRFRLCVSGATSFSVQDWKRALKCRKFMHQPLVSDMANLWNLSLYPFRQQ